MQTHSSTLVKTVAYYDPLLQRYARRLIQNEEVAALERRWSIWQSRSTGARTRIGPDALLPLVERARSFPIRCSAARSGGSREQ